MTLNLKITLKNGEQHFCYGVSAAAKASGILEKTLRYHLQQGNPYEKNGIKVQEVNTFPKLEVTISEPTRLIIKGKIVKE